MENEVMENGEVMESKEWICYNCGCVIDVDNDPYAVIDGKYYCEDCYAVCDHCGNAVPLDDAEWIGDSLVCSECLENSGDFVQCASCGDWIATDDAASSNDDGDCLCEGCYDNGRRFCVECGRLMNDNYGEILWYDDDPYCEDCVPERSIHDYGYDPIWDYLGGKGHVNDGEIRYGVELEVDSDDSRCGAVETARDVLDCEKYAYCKHDGSLDEGFEIISHPATLDYHLNNFNWDGICAICRDAGFRSHDTTTCGLHVHIGREALGVYTDAKIVAVIDKLWPQVERFARRSSNGYAQKPDAYIEDDDMPDVMVEKARKSGNYDRYKAVNLGSKADTVEIRIFRGTLKPSTIRATIVFCDCVVRYCLTHTVKECSRVTFADIAAMSDNEEFHNYLKVRKLED